MKVDKILIYFFHSLSSPLLFDSQSEKNTYIHLCFSTQIFQTQDVILHRMYHRDY